MVSLVKHNTMKASNGKALSLHDSISLGEVELGLSSEHRPSEEEVRRLPLLLRLLSSSRPLSSIPTFPLPPIDDNDDDDDDNKSESTDVIIQQAVNRLEDRAALYSAAEGVEVVACHLAPYVCRKISRLAPLQRMKVKGGKKSGTGSAKTGGAGEFGTDELARLAANPVLASGQRSSSTATSKRQKMSSEASDDLQTDLQTDEDEDMADASGNATQNAITNANNKRRRASSAAHESVLAAGNSEDSQEATVTKTLSELALLVVQSLQSNATPRKADNDGGGGEGEEKSSLSLTIEDSILAEPRQGQGSGGSASASVSMGSVGGGGAMVASDLGSMVVSLMHHAPVLRHRHVAVSLLYTLRCVVRSRFESC
jgi:hypothetical protein